MGRLAKYRRGILLVSIAITAACYHGSTPKGIGAPAPDFTVQDGERKVTLDQFRGKVVVLNFWASWCPPCVQETPSLSQFAAAYAGKGVVVLGISVDKDEKAYRNFLQKFQPAFQIARDLTIHEDYGTFMYPETYIIDANGRVLKKIVEVPDWPGSPDRFSDWTDPKLAQYINSLL